MYIVFLMLLVVIAGTAYFISRDVRSPAVIQPMVWFLPLLGYQLSGSAFYEISYVTVLYVCIGSALFSFSVIMSSTTYKHKQACVKLHLNTKGVVANILFLLPILLLPAFIWKAHSLSLYGPGEALLQNIRFSINQEGEGYGLYAYLVTLAFGSAAVHFLIASENGKWWKTIILIAISLVYAFFSTGRTSFFLLCLMLLGIAVIKRIVDVKMALIGFMLAAIIIFFMMGALLNKGASLEADWAENLVLAKDALLIYLVSPLVAFDQSVSWDGMEGGKNVFRFFVALAKGVGFEVEPVKLVQEFIRVPLPTNVYTFYQPYVRDFGWLGGLLAQIILGLMHGAIYKRALYGQRLWQILYGLSLYPLVMQFFHDQYFSLISQWLQYSILFVFSLTLIDKTRHHTFRASNTAV